VIAYDNNDNFLNYTSVVAATGTHKISAQLDQTQPGVNILLTATAPSHGYGTLGTAASTLTLSGSAQTVISGIGSCWTGTTGTDGAALLYSITFDNANFDKLLTDTPIRTVTFTISN
jgi:hypothetical protein